MSLESHTNQKEIKGLNLKCATYMGFDSSEQAIV